MKVGFFDSGVGGITVLYEALKVISGIDYLYFADTANVPYGPKPKETVKAHIMDAVEFMAGKGIEALVVACNTATSIAIEDLRSKYSFPILGMEPAVKPAVERCGEKRVLVLATSLTLKEDKFQQLTYRVDSRHMVDALPLPGLVEFAEGFVFDGNEVVNYLKGEFSSFDMEQYGTIVLGCTHFNFFRPVMKRILGSNVDIIDGSVGTVMHLKNVLETYQAHMKAGNGKIEFYSSDKNERDDARFIRYIDFLKRIQA